MTPGTRRLLQAWATLMMLSLGLAVAADVNHVSRLGAPWMVAIAVVTALKSRIILGDYLGLKASRGAHIGFTLAVALTMAIVVGAFIAVPV